MKLKSLVAASAALSLAAAPAIAAPTAPAPAPAAESVEGSEFYRTGILLPLAGIVALALVIYLIVDSAGGDDDPVSP